MAKAKKTRAAPIVRRGGKLPDINWEGWEKWSGQKYNKFRRNAISFYYDNYKLTDLQPNLYKWMEASGYSKDDVRAMKEVPSWRVPATPCILAKCLTIGMPDVNPVWDEYWVSLKGTGDTVPRAPTAFINEFISNIIEDGRHALKVKKEEAGEEQKESAAPTIQDRIREQAINMAEPIDNWLETFIINPKTFNAKGFDINAHFTTVNLTQAHARKIIGFYEAELNEIRTVKLIPTPAKLKKIKDEKELAEWEQIIEGYAHLRKADVAKYVDALETLVGACTLVIDASKATRKPRKRAAPSAEKLVAKIKYKVKDDKYQVASINPIDIIGASELWIFNIKTRKIGRYVADNPDHTGQKRSGSGLQVKGTTLIGFNENESIQKTLRKPLDQLKEFKLLGKVKLRKFINSIATTDTKLNGRFNTDTILLKVT